MRKITWFVHSRVFVSHAAAALIYAARIRLVLMAWSVGQKDIAKSVKNLIINAAEEERVKKIMP